MLLNGAWRMLLNAANASEWYFSHMPNSDAGHWMLEAECSMPLLAKIVKDCNAGEICEFGDVQHIKKYILDIFYERVHYNPSVDAYSREKLTNKLSTLLHSIT